MTTAPPGTADLERRVSVLEARASFLWERLDRLLEAGSTGPVDPEITKRGVERLADWATTVAGGDQARLERHLAGCGLARPALLRALGAPPAATPAPWPAIFVEALRMPPDLGRDRAADGRDPVPFEEALVPFVVVARRRLADHAGPLSGQLTADAHAALERGLLRRLSAVAGPTLYDEFALVRYLGQGVPDVFGPTHDRNGGPDGTYLGFVRWLRAGGMLEICEAHPVLARLLSTVAGMWVGAVGEFLVHLEQDRPRIERRFRRPRPPLGPVVDCRYPLSDMHRGGRCVFSLTFDSGRRLVYRPRSAQKDRVIADFVAWLNRQGLGHELVSPAVLDRGDHAWIEFVENQPCPNRSAVRRYYRRAGSLLAVAHAMCAADLHHENVVAAGEHPVVVDWELAPFPLPPRATPAGGGDDAAETARRALLDSVLRVGLLPGVLVRRDGLPVDDSGLGGVGERPASEPRLLWHDVNRDDMTVTFDFPSRPAGANTVWQSGTVQSAVEHAADLERGFCEAYSLIESRRTELTRQGGPLARLERSTVRWLPRLTRDYVRVIEHALTAGHLRDGLDFSFALDRLRAPMLMDKRHGALASLLPSEARALERLDVPIYEVSFRDDSVRDADPRGGVRCFDGSPAERLAARIGGLSSGDMQRQRAFIRLVTSPVGPAAQRNRACAATGTSLPELTPAAAAVEAAAIADALRRAAFVAADGSAAWIAPRYFALAGQVQPGVSAHDLYNGGPGVAVFLGALEFVTGGAGYRDLAYAALSPLRRMLHAEPDRLARSGLGAATGLGSAAHALALCSAFLADPDLLAEAEAAAHLISPVRVANDARLDVMSGSAGAVLCLLGLHRRTGNDAWLQAAHAAGRQLLERRITGGAGTCAWPTLGGRALGGFSHGASGIAVALLRLARRTNEPTFREAAVGAIGWERGLYCEAVGNWRDARWGEQEPRFQSGWCHGPPGIGLARLELLRTLDDNRAHGELETAFRHGERNALQGVDHLCCGEAGRVELLVASAQQLKRPELLQSARGRAAALVARSAASGGYRTTTDVPDAWTNPSLFTGIAGIGYTLLRTAEPERLPSLLRWE